MVKLNDLMIRDVGHPVRDPRDLTMVLATIADVTEEVAVAQLSQMVVDESIVGPATVEGPEVARAVAVKSGTEVEETDEEVDVEAGHLAKTMHRRKKRRVKKH